ncbi:MAG: carbohydrate-binding domain-containing protein [Oscillospiraceae bacterium]|nr:carbohydrate-binding domain-containing protein [Oscillospiraceae bacterium]
MLKKFFAVLSASMLVTAICASAEQINTTIEETSSGLSVSVTATENGGMYIIGAKYGDGGLIEGIAVQHIDDAVSGEVYTAELNGIHSGSIIYIWDDNQKPLCEKIEYNGTDATPEPDVTPTPEPEGDGIIHLKGTEIDASGVEGAEVNGNIVTITAVGDYIIEGTLDDGQIVISDSLGKKDAVNITLQGVNVTCSDSAPFNGGGGKIGITLADGTTNIFTDLGKYTNYTTSKDPKGCFYSRRDLDIGGSGTLVVNGNVKNGLVCGADLKIKRGANLDVTAANNAVKGDNGVEFTNKTGTVNITSGGDGIKSDAIDTDIVETGAIEADKGYVLIEGGTFTINAEGDGIQADNYCTITGGNITINSVTEGIKANEVDLPILADDAVVEGEYINGKITISGGTLDITSGEDGIEAAELVDISGGTISIIVGGGSSKSYSDDTSRKGIKADTDINISGGNITVNSSDDSIHSNWNVTITGGEMNLATGDDGVHADYTLTLGTENGGDEDFTIDIATSYEGIEGSVINILSGTTYLYATDDGVNAAGDYTEDGILAASITTFAGPGGNQPGGPGGNRPGGPDWGADDSAPYGMLYIKGGRTYVEANGDGLDSNGSIEMSGGIVLVNGPTSGGNGVFDKGDSSSDYFKVTGGTLIGAGTSDMAVTPTVTGQSYFLQSNGNGSAGTPMKINNANITFIPKTTWKWFFVTTPDMASGGSYSISTASTYGSEIFGKTVNNKFYGLAQSN